MKLNRVFSMQEFKKKYDLVENQKSIKIILLIIMIGRVHEKIEQTHAKSRSMATAHNHLND